ncbi:zinc finger protein 91-like [Daktulosphaira vitifoliae]|uniref:zinc finger protein 91-like n=1 Tax=Daktulosphaira vitifoliae TaxID=58002 RepID=UPI0021AA426A|nr:zinc finger protein 91-like [Daktulosphaira vitifoliae]
MMDNSQINLHSENFDLCRICLLEPESNRKIKFLNIFMISNNDNGLNQHMFELLGVKVEKDDIKPKIICENCHKSLLSWVEMKKKATESQIVINYIAKKFTNNSSKKCVVNSSEPDSSFEFGNNINPHASSFNKKICTKNEISNIKINSSQSYENPILPSKRSLSTSSENDDIYENPMSEITETNDIICISDSEESVDVENISQNIKSNEESHYCSICKKQQYNHDCSQFNKEFSTCLVPNCNIIFRAVRDFFPHYRQHIGMSPGSILCRQCYKENKKSSRDDNGEHIHSDMTNLFKCYTCNISFNSMLDIAQHKLTQHNSRIINSSGNYLCYYCEKSSPDLAKINDHIKYCKNNQLVKNQQNKPETYSIPKIDPISKSTNRITIKKNDVDLKKERLKTTTTTAAIPCKLPVRTADQVLFTCLKPSCNIISQNFQNFKTHCRDHLNIGNNVMCWQCVSDFPDVTALRNHQTQGNCQKPGMFECFECSTKYDDIQGLSVHKLIVHECTIVSKNRKTMICPFCKTEHNINVFRNHLTTCQNKQKKKVISNQTKTKLIEKRTNFKCKYCKKICQTQAALVNHLKKHERLKTINSLSIKSNCDSTISNNKSVTSSIDVTETTNFPEKIIDSSRKISANNKNKLVNIEMFPFINNLYFCIKCPKKFVSQAGLTEHWIHCSNVGIKRAKPIKNKYPLNYYCTKCKEYYSCLEFGQHWKIKHGKKLVSNKYKRYSCRYCPSQFKYKIALAMHKEHEHNEESISNITEKKTVDCVVMLPIISQTTSLAANNIENTMLVDQSDSDSLVDEKEVNVDTTFHKDHINEKQENAVKDPIINEKCNITHLKDNIDKDGELFVNHESCNNAITTQPDQLFDGNSLVEEVIVDDTEMDESSLNEVIIHSQHDEILLDNIHDVVDNIENQNEEESSYKEICNQGDLVNDNNLVVEVDQSEMSVEV